MVSLIVALVFFAAIHLGVSGTTLRDRAIAAMGEKIYQAAFAIASVVGLIWSVLAYNGAPYVETWGFLEWWKPIAILLMIPSFALVVIGLTTPNPTTVGQERLVDRPPQGIVRVTRHPFLTGVALWALVHLIGNGDLASLLFFGTLGVVAVAGTVSIDGKRRRLLGPGAWDAFASATSIIPFSAIVGRRNRFVASEIRPWRWAAAAIAYLLFLGGHAHIVGVSPFPT